MPDVLIQMILKYACSCQMRNSSLHYKNCCLYDGHIDDVFCSLYQTMRNSYWNNLTCKFRNAAYRLTMLGIVDFTEFFFHYGPACDEINAKMRLSYIIETGCWCDRVHHPTCKYSMIPCNCNYEKPWLCLADTHKCSCRNWGKKKCKAVRHYNRPTQQPTITIHGLKKVEKDKLKPIGITTALRGD